MTLVADADTGLTSRDMITTRVPDTSEFLSERLVGSDWVAPIIAQLKEFAELPHDWDSYGGKPVEQDVAVYALNVLLAFMKPTTPQPAAVPLPDGGVQFEWSTAAIDLEISISVPGIAEVTGVNQEDPGGFEFQLTNNFYELAKIVDELSGTPPSAG